MSAKIACLIPPRWSLAEYALHTCDDRSHSHFSQSQFNEQLRDGSVELLRWPDMKRGVKAVVRMVRISKRGISCSAGETLAWMLLDDDTRMVAQTMLAEIRMTRETRTEEKEVCTAYL